MKGTNNEYIFICNNCNHEFKQIIKIINQGSWCSYCAGKKLCDKNCNECFTAGAILNDTI